MSSNNMRDLIARIGIGQFNATMVINMMLVAPATTDPKSPPVMLLVKHIQKALTTLGYAVPTSGYLDQRTAEVIEHVCGRGWESRPWSDTVKAVVIASSAPKTVVTTVKPAMGALPSLPDVPGGKLTYVAAAAAALYFWNKKRR
jgi:hypothetical protein